MKATLLVFLLCGSALADFAAGERAMKNGDHVAALKEFLPLAEEGDAGAQVYVGFLYGHGQGILHDYNQAARWLRLAAEQGRTDAQLRLGIIYEKGSEGFAQDDKEAVKWYRVAAEQGNAEAQYSIGYLYSMGLGVPQDYVEAHMWLNLGGVNGDATSIGTRDFVARKMTPGQIELSAELGNGSRRRPGKSTLAPRHCAVLSLALEA
jgi:hypothetical protein